MAPVRPNWNPDGRVLRGDGGGMTPHPETRLQDDLFAAVFAAHRAGVPIPNISARLRAFVKALERE